MNQQVNGAFKTFITGEAVEAWRRVKLSSGTIVYADAGEDFIAVTQEAAALAAPCNCKMKGQSGTMLIEAAGDFAVDVALYGAADGKVDEDVSGESLGYAAELSSADEDKIEVIPAGGQTVQQSHIADPVDTSTAVTDDSGGVDPADQTIAVITPAAEITDSSGGADPGDDTIAVVTNMATITDSTGGGANTTLVAVTEKAGGAGVELTSGDPAIINDNFADIAAQLAIQKTANTAILAAVAQLAAKLNTTSTALIAAKAAVALLAAEGNKKTTSIGTNNAAVDSILSALEAVGTLATA